MRQEIIDAMKEKKILFDSHKDDKRQDELSVIIRNELNKEIITPHFSNDDARRIAGRIARGEFKGKEMNNLVTDILSLLKKDNLTEKKIFDIILLIKMLRKVNDKATEHIMKNKLWIINYKVLAPYII